MNERITGRTVYTYNDTPVSFVKHAYQNGRVALEMLDEREEESYLTATTNFPQQDIPDGYAFIKNYSENQGLYDWLIANRIVEAAAQPAGIDGHMWPFVKILI